MNVGGKCVQILKISILLGLVFFAGFVFYFFYFQMYYFPKSIQIYAIILFVIHRAIALLLFFIMIFFYIRVHWRNKFNILGLVFMPVCSITVHINF